jgi:hypothetical protein
MRVLVACEFSGIVRDAFLARGHDAWSCDLLPTEKEGPHIQDDVLKHLNDGWDLMIAHPPCTYHTVAGNKYFYQRPKSYNPDNFYLEKRFKAREDARQFVILLWSSNIPKIVLENPVGTLHEVIGKSSQIIQPYMFGHDFSKKTCLWLKGLPPSNPLPIDKWVAPRIVIINNNNYKRWNNQSDKTGSDTTKRDKDRWKNRSRTFTGIAKAMAEQWG